MGCTQKCGRAPVSGVLQYGDLLALSPLFLLIDDFEHLCRGYFRRNACQETSGHIQQGCRRQQPDAHALDLRAGWLVCRISQGDGSR
ncbi:Uncharacterised protein [Segatella copri]|nr:Uncharacterised protein [Segatella copri]